MNSLFTRVAFVIAFVAVSFGVNAQSISSTLNGRTGVTVNGQESFTVTLNRGSLSQTTNVKVGILLDNPAQAANLVLEMQNPIDGTYAPLVFDGNGNSISGEQMFFMNPNPLNLRVTFSAAGVYDYKVAIFDVNTVEIVSTDESVTVAPLYTAPTIASSQNGANYAINTQNTYTVTSTAGSDAGTAVRVFFKMNAAQVANTDIEYYEVFTSSWQPFNINGNGEANFGPLGGFPLSDATTQFRSTYSAPGTYNYKLAIYRAVAPFDTLAVVNESFTVTAVAPTIESDLDGITVFTNDVTNFEITTVANDYAGVETLVYFEALDAPLIPNVNIEILQGGNWYPVDISSGSSTFPAFPLVSGSQNLRVTFDAPGTYPFKLSLVETTNDDTLAFSSETVIVEDRALPTISTDINGDTLIVGVQTPYSVTTTTGDYAGTNVRVFFKMDPAQIGNATSEYFEPNPSPGAWQLLTLPANGEFIFGATPGFPLSATSSSFRVNYSIPGVYNSKMAIVRAAAPYDTLAFAYEHVVVRERLLPTISSNLPSLSPLTTDVEADFEVTTVANEYLDTLVRGFIQLADASQAGDVEISFDNGGTFVSLPLDANGAASFGPLTGFPLGDITTDFKVTFGAAGVYNYKLAVYSVNSTDTLDFTNESVTVVDPAVVVPTISSDLDARTGVEVNTEEAFTITTVANDFDGEDVRIKITLETPAQGPNFFITYNTANVTFDANGVAYIGTVAGFPLDDEDFDLEVTFLDGGTYAYNIALIQVSNDSILAENDEEVFVLDNSSIADNASFISNTFPNPTEGIVNIQTTETGVGTLGVYTVTGQKVINQTINGSVNTVSLETLPAGLYIIKISQNEKDAVIRVVKK